MRFYHRLCVFLAGNINAVWDIRYSGLKMVSYREATLVNLREWSSVCPKFASQQILYGAALAESEEVLTGDGGVEWDCSGRW